MSRSTAFAATLALHALVLGAILAYAPAREALMDSVIMVNFIAPPRAEPRLDPPTSPPKPKPVTRRIPRLPEPVPITAPATEAPVPAVAPAAPARFAPLASPEPALTPVTPPIFNADYLENPPPPYPPLSRRLGEHGRVILRVLVSSTGRADEVEVRTSSGHARLDDAARETVRLWKFVPARRGSARVAAWVLIPISFTLEG